MNEYKLYEEGFSIPQVYKKTGIPLSTLRLRFKKAGILRSRTEALKLASRQGRLGLSLRGKKRQFTQEHKDNIKKARIKWGQENRKGWTLKSSGYVECTFGPNKYRRQHDIIMEQHIGRKIS